VARLPKVIILNGVGSVGKTSTIQALQAITARPMLHAAMDSFLAMVPESLFGHPDGLIFEAGTDCGQPSVAIRSGPALGRAMRGMRHAIAAMAAQGNDLLVDEVIIGTEATDEYRTLLAPFEVRWVGLFASLEVLEQRERARGDRQIGLARWQYTRVHRAIAYDLEIDTTATTPDENARMIRDAFGL
jgi:chloramphenicol 3-O phosphotransferase